MKKLFAIFMLTAIFSLSAFAEGDLPVGNRDCKPTQQCLFDPHGTLPEPVESKTADLLVTFKTWFERIFG